MGIVARKLQQKPLWAIQSSYFSRALVDAAKAVPGMTWDASIRSWVGYIDAVEATCDILTSKGITADRSQVDAHLAAGHKHHALYTVTGADGRTLRDYQKQGVDFLICEARSGALLTLDMGLGKSATSIIACRALGGKTLIICPSSARSVWADTQRGEIAKWWPRVLGSIFCPKGTTSKKTPLAIPPDTSVVVIHYDILWAWVELLINWEPSNIIWDEAHMLQSEKSRRSKASKELAIAPSVMARIALTGTPLTNRVKDLWNLVDTVSPKRFGRNFFAYGLIHCDGHQEEISRDIGSVWKFDGKSNLDALHKRLSHFTFRRTKEDVKLELPPKTRQVIRLDIPVSYRQTNVEKIDKRLMHQVLARAVDGKMPQVVELIRDHLESGQSVVAFTFRQAVAEHLVTQLTATGFPCRFIHGGVLTSKRDVIINELRDASTVGPVLLVATIDTCAVSIDLTFATVGVFAELTYEPHELLQAESRLHRYPQTSNVTIQYPIGIGTLEEIISEIVIDRLDTFEKLIGKTDGLARALAGDEDVDLIAQLGARLFAMTAPSADEETPKTKTRRKAK